MTAHDPLCQWRPDRTHPFDPDCHCDLIARVRMDQDNRECDHCMGGGRITITDLRAKVEALEIRQPWGPAGTAMVSRHDVLTLIMEAQK